MTPQAIPPHRQGPRARRWLVFALLGLVLGAWLVLELLPRLGGSLLGTDWSKRESGVDWGQVEVVWDPTDPRTGKTANSPSPQAEAGAPAAAEPALPPEPGEEAPVREPAGGAPAAPAPAAAAAGGNSAPGPSGAAPAAGRDSPRILYAAWPSRSLLAGLKASGRLRYRLRVEPDGRVSAWELLDDGGFDCAPCRGEAERIIRELRFAPGTLDGRPVACWVPYEISFEKGGR